MMTWIMQCLINRISQAISKKGVNKMRKMVTVLIIGFAMSFASLTCRAESIFSGQVMAGDEELILAPYSGRISEMHISEGNRIAAGDIIATMDTDKVFAQVDGTASGVFAYEGDNAESAVERYGAVLYIEPDNKFSLDSSTAKAYGNSENKYVHIGEVVYLSCTRDGSHRGRGIVTGIDDEDEKKYTVEIFEGEFYMNETVGIFRQPDYASLSKIGIGTVIRTQPIAIKAEGSILRMHVENGDKIARGQLLFETVASTFNELKPSSSEIVSNVEGIVASVAGKKGEMFEKGEPIATIYPMDSLQIQMLVPEASLSEIMVGDNVLVEFNWNSDRTRKYEGVISSISYISQSQEQATSFSTNYFAYVDFEPDQSIRLGMTAVVYIQ